MDVIQLFLSRLKYVENVKTVHILLNFYKKNHTNSSLSINFPLLKIKLYIQSNETFQ